MKRFLLLGALAACGGASSEGPLRVTTGVGRTYFFKTLRPNGYCPGADLAADDAASETFPRCDAPGVEYGESWVVAYYDEGRKVVKVQRWEKYAETDRAVERWNALVEARAKDTQPSDAAKAQLGAIEPLPAGTRSWVAFEGDHQLIGVYLLDPRPPSYANVLEEIVEVNAEARR